MTGKQTFLKSIYPAFIRITKFFGMNSNSLSNDKKQTPASPIYELDIELNNGQKMPLRDLKGKKILLVNTASNCGYTAQYDDLQKLSEKFENKLTIIGFPANDFKEQEKGSDEEIAEFCKVNFGVKFPLAKKSSVIKKDDQNAIFQWLSDSKKNGWNDKEPTWNFSKYLIDEEGNLANYFDPSVGPMSEEVLEAVSK
ncbi:MAG: glutathione peroxidase [Gemmatimonadaceae bacterium]|nr:glutathione peroxidase [Chitinophagaceae bacterium]